MRSRALLLVLVTLLAGVAAPCPASGDAAQLTIRVSPAVAYEPASLFVQVLIERNAENRLIRITAASAEYFTSSEAQLDGEHSPRLRTIRFRELPAGEYELEGQVFGDRGRVMMSARTTAIVVGR